jgi:hypothetical protein
MGFTWDARSRLTFKRQKRRREDDRSYVPDLGQIIGGIQREAAALSTGALRDEIEVNLEIQDAAIRYFLGIGPGKGTEEDLIAAGSTMWFSVLTTALYVRELAARPVDRFAVVISPN